MFRPGCLPRFYFGSQEVAGFSIDECSLAQAVHLITSYSLSGTSSSSSSQCWTCRHVFGHLKTNAVINASLQLVIVISATLTRSTMSERGEERDFPRTDIVFGREVTLWQSQGLFGFSEACPSWRRCRGRGTVVWPCCNREAVDTVIVRFSIDPKSVSAFLRG